jgi:plasmid maintenance system antidote protein VapI
VPNLIQQRLNELNMTQRELAERLKITENYLNKIIKEKRRCSLLLGIRIAQELGTTVEHLFSPCS